MSFSGSGSSSTQPFQLQTGALQLTYQLSAPGHLIDIDLVHSGAQPSTGSRLVACTAYCSAGNDGIQVSPGGWYLDVTVTIDPTSILADPANSGWLVILQEYR